MDSRYQPHRIEKKWQAYWEAHGVFRTPEDPQRPKCYVLEMFPYPSGRIHMGHVRNYTLGDVVARYKRMRGYRVLHPMGWDAFGLPAENAAIAHGVHPARWTLDNIAAMRQQLKRMGFSYDWDREVTTCDPEYYRWNQWLFIQMLKKGLAYRKRSVVNWCASCETVLANEQVTASGGCWRCDQPVTQRELEQWFLRITDYAEELLEGCDRLTGWPERVRTMQRHWIGKSEGVEIDFPLADGSGVITVFTTRVDTVYGATFMSLAPEHPLVEKLCRGTPQEAAVRAFVSRATRMDRDLRTSEAQEKEGVFTGAYAINPMTREKIPVWVASFVLMEYGTGAVMAVPTHDQRDFAFARQHGLPLRVVVQPPEGGLTPENMDRAYTDPGVLVNSGPFDGLRSEEAQVAIAQHMEAHGIGRRTVNYRLRDWGISRQRYWGTPIPVIYCSSCGAVPVREEDLPVLLPRDVRLTGKGGSPLATVPEFLEAPCPQCGKPGRRETDTMDTFVDSSWYFFRYASPRATAGPVDPEAIRQWLPVDQYIGGIEHATMHLLYCRFFTKVMRDLGLVDLDEPVEHLLTQGMVIKDGAKMSKSKGNVVDPDYLIETYGADTARLFCLFAAPPEKDLDWSDQGVEGAYRFLGRLWRLLVQRLPELEGVAPYAGPMADLPRELRDLRRLTHVTIRRVTENMEERHHFNTAISAIHELVNALGRWEGRALEGQAPAVFREALEAVTLLLSPFAPHLAEEMWEALGHSPSVAQAPWPAWDPEAVQAESVLIVVQVNGKLRSRITLPPGADEATVREAALRDERVRPFVAGKTIRKVVVVPDRLVNIVV